MNQAGIHWPKVQVLLATYNGEEYLRAQIDSIFAQVGVEVCILASDDGSTDKTRDILLTYQERCPDRFHVLPYLDPTGSAKWNFLRLLKAAAGEYVALADQDDLWLPYKLQRSMAQMHELEKKHGSNKPLLVFTDAVVVDRDLASIHDSLWRNQQLDPERVHRLRNLLVQNVVTGCTMLLNRKLRLRITCFPAGAVMHDWWIALVACAFGHSAPLHEATVLYRQHSTNSVGAVLNRRRRWIPHIREHAERRASWEAAVCQGVAFLEVFGGQLSSEQGQLMRALVKCEQSTSRFVRVGTLLHHRIFQKGLRANLTMLWYLWDMKAAKRARVSTNLWLQP